jgi:anti-sigma factor RsiW
MAPYYDKDLEAAAMRQFEAHLTGCSTCQQRFEEYIAIIQAAQAAMLEVQPAVSYELMTRVQTSFGTP